jgi:hypothetical protein
VQTAYLTLSLLHPSIFSPRIYLSNFLDTYLVQHPSPFPQPSHVSLLYAFTHLIMWNILFTDEHSNAEYTVHVLQLLWVRFAAEEGDLQIWRVARNVNK